ncbi:MAG: hypothetical protein ABSD31_03560 [Candidatus Binataceae bacterium]
MIGTPNEARRRPLCGVWRKEYQAKRSFESFQPFGKIELFKRAYVAVVGLHPELLVQVNKASVERTVVRWRKGNAILHLLGASGRSHRKNMCSNKPQLFRR